MIDGELLRADGHDVAVNIVSKGITARKAVQSFRNPLPLGRVVA